MVGRAPGVPDIQQGDAELNLLAEGSRTGCAGWRPPSLPTGPFPGHTGAAPGPLATTRTERAPAGDGELLIRSWSLDNYLLMPWAARKFGQGSAERRELASRLRALRARCRELPPGPRAQHLIDEASRKQVTNPA